MGEKRLRIGLISDFLSSEYSDNLVKGLTTYCSENDIEAFLFPIGDLHKDNPDNYNYQFSSITSLITSENLDGLVVAAGTLMHNMLKKDFTDYLKRFAPVQLLNIAAELPRIPSLVVDCKQAFESLIQYLIDVQGCRRFGFMGVESQSEEVALRTKIFRDVLKRNNIKFDEKYFWKTNFSYTSAYVLLNNHRKTYGSIDLDAIISLNDDTAYACIDYCTTRMNMRVPEDIVITGFDNLQRASFSNPTLTSVNQQIEYLSYSGAQALHQKIRGKVIPLRQTIRARTILRQSTAKDKKAQSNLEGNSYITVDQRTGKDFTNSFSVSEWYTRRSEILQAANFYSEMNNTVLIDDLCPVITNSLRGFGLQAAAVVVYDNPIEMPNYFEKFPLPRKARVLAGFDYQAGFNAINFEKPYYFNPNEVMFPKELMWFPPCGTIVTSLFTYRTHYGYLLLRLNNYDAGVYELIQKAISNQLKASFEYEKVCEQQAKMKRQNKKLDLIANTDELTGLRNRRGFMDLGQQALNLSKEMDQNGLVVFCDMDGLKKINDTFGHESGDVAIRAQAQILNKAFRTNDILGRLGGDEFALICPGLTEDRLSEIKTHVEKACKEWKKETKSKFDLSISMGSISYPTKNDGYNMATLLARADNCLYMEKRAKKNKR